MAHSQSCVALMGRLTLSARPTIRIAPIQPSLQPRIQTRTKTSAKQLESRAKQDNIKKARSSATNKNDLAKQRSRKKGEVLKKKKKPQTSYTQYNTRDLEQFSLCDAMRAAEVGYPPTQAKYEVAVKLKSLKNGPVLRNRLRLPHPVKSDIRVCVICPSKSKYADEARAAGASVVGEEEVFDAVKAGRIEFDRCVCQIDSLQKLNAAGLGRFLGPRGLMPSTKTGTVIKDPANAVKTMVGAAEYREKLGVVRMAVGQLGFTPEELQRNIKAFMDQAKKDMDLVSEKITKEIAEVVLSSTHGPGMSLNGNFIDADSEITARQLSTA